MTFIFMLWLFRQYLLWSGEYYTYVVTSYNSDELKKGILYLVSAPQSVQDSWKYVNFWKTYYFSKYLDI